MIREAVCSYCGADTTEVQSAKTGQWIMCEKSPVDAVLGGNDIFITMSGMRYVGHQRMVGNAVDNYLPPVQVYKLHRCRKEKEE